MKDGTIPVRTFHLTDKSRGEIIRLLEHDDSTQNCRLLSGIMNTTI